MPKAVSHGGLYCYGASKANLERQYETVMQIIEAIRSKANKET